MKKILMVLLLIMVVLGNTVAQEVIGNPGYPEDALPRGFVVHLDGHAWVELSIGMKRCMVLGILHGLHYANVYFSGWDGDRIATVDGKDVITIVMLVDAGYQSVVARDLSIYTSVSVAWIRMIGGGFR